MEKSERSAKTVKRQNVEKAKRGTENGQDGGGNHPEGDTFARPSDSTSIAITFKAITLVVCGNAGGVYYIIIIIMISIIM